MRASLVIFVIIYYLYIINIQYNMIYIVKFRL